MNAQISDHAQYGGYRHERGESEGDLLANTHEWAPLFGCADCYTEHFLSRVATVTTFCLSMHRYDWHARASFVTVCCHGMRQWHLT